MRPRRGQLKFSRPRRPLVGSPGLGFTWAHASSQSSSRLGGAAGRVERSAHLLRHRWLEERRRAEIGLLLAVHRTPPGGRILSPRPGVQVGGQPRAGQTPAGDQEASGGRFLAGDGPVQVPSGGCCARRRRLGRGHLRILRRAVRAPVLQDASASSMSMNSLRGPKTLGRVLNSAPSRAGRTGLGWTALCWTGPGGRQCAGRGLADGAKKLHWLPG